MNNEVLCEVTELKPDELEMISGGAINFSSTEIIVAKSYANNQCSVARGVHDSNTNTSHSI